jgi:virginiamycin B lyase
VRARFGASARVLARATLLLASLAGCTGGAFAPAGSAAVPALQRVGPAQAAGRARKARATFRIAWVRKRRRRGQRYVAPTARSVAVSVNLGPPQYADAPVEKIVLDAPIGTDMFTILLYDAKGGQGRLLARAFVSKRIVLGAPNVVSATLGGVIASLSVSLANPSPAAGTAASSAVQVTAYDADGNAIVGASDYIAPIHLSVSDPEKSGALSLSNQVLQSPSSSATLAYSGGTLWEGGVVAKAEGAAAVTASFDPKPTIYQYAMPSSGALGGIAAGPDGRMWFAEAGTGKIAAITTSGSISEYGNANSTGPSSVTTGSDGALWFAEYNGNAIGRMTTAGVVTNVYPAPNPAQGPVALLDRGDGSIWYGANSGGRLGQVSLATGAQLESGVLAPGAFIRDVASAGGDVWFTDCSTSAIGRMTSINAVPTVFPLAASSFPVGLTLGSDGNLWFAEAGTSRIGVMDLSGNIVAEYPTPHVDSQPWYVAKGADGAIWFTEFKRGAIGRVTTSGSMTEYALPLPGGGYGIAVAPDGAIWFTEFSGNHVGKLVY